MPEYAVGLEGGVGPLGDAAVAGDITTCEGHECYAWMAVLQNVAPAVDGAGGSQKWGLARTGTFALPRSVSALLREGLELGHATDRVFHEVNSKQKGGSVAPPLLQRVGVRCWVCVGCEDASRLCDRKRVALEVLGSAPGAAIGVKVWRCKGLGRHVVAVCARRPDCAAP